MIHWLMSILLTTATPTHQNDSLAQTISAQLLYAVKTNKPAESLVLQIAQLNPDTLQQSLKDDASKKTFWLNMYNAWYQLLAVQYPKAGKKIFRMKQIQIAGRLYSLDQIEHGILRKYRWKYSLGYFPSLFTPKHIRQSAVASIDYRIHFALNCGAKSCPAIAFYTPEKIDQQLVLATKVFLQQETVINDASRTVTTTKIIQWFIGDFGGRKKVLELLSTITGKDLSGYRLKFAPYDWTRQLLYFQE